MLDLAPATERPATVEQMRPWVKAVLVFVVLAIAAGAFVVVRSLFIGTAAAGPECIVARDPSLSVQQDTVVDLGSATQTTADISLAAVQLQHASTINAVGLAKQIPIRGRIIAIATALQESSLRNLEGGDRDSVGLFQQRPSQGWGTVEQISDPVYSAGIFYDRLLEVPNWQDLPLTQAAQEVQYSGHPDAYAKWESEAAQLVGALSGTWGAAAVSCRDGAAASTAAAPDRELPAGFESAGAGLANLVSAADSELGALTPVAIEDQGRTAVLTVEVPEMTADTAAITLAYWIVAHAASLGVDGVTIGLLSWSGENTWATLDTALAAGQVRVTMVDSPSTAS